MKGVHFEPDYPDKILLCIKYNNMSIISIFSSLLAMNYKLTYNDIHKQPKVIFLGPPVCCASPDICSKVSRDYFNIE